jgi:hypothetical protein
LVLAVVLHQMEALLSYHFKVLRQSAVDLVVLFLKLQALRVKLVVLVVEEATVKQHSRVPAVREPRGKEITVETLLVTVDSATGLVVVAVELALLDRMRLVEQVELVELD